MVRGLARCLLALLAGSCGILEPPIASMRVEPDHDPIPRNYGDDLFVPMSDLDDPKGLAGIEIRVSWPGSDTLTFTATDLPSPEFEVPNDGSIWVDARLRQNGEIVSEGSANWYLDPGAEWTVFVNRVPAPLHSAPDRITGPNPVPCAWWWCHQLWRFELREDVRNHTLEALWLLVYRSHPDECADIC